MPIKTDRAVNSRCIFGLLALLAPLVSIQPLYGQIQSFGIATHHLSFTEVDAATRLPVANPNGIIEPGEAARVSLSISFDPPVGSIVYAWHNPTEPQTVVAFCYSKAEVIASSGAWSHPQLAPGWNFTGMPTAANGRYAILDAAQNHVNANTSNYIMDIWHAIWTPTIYTNGMTLIYTWPRGISPLNSSAIWLRDPQWNHSPASVNTQIAEILIPTSAVPAPGTGVVVLGGLLICGRRRRS
jgi:hypothetical protein